jgi:hypothetical protein
VERDVCERVMRRWPVLPTVREEEICSWCYAATHVGSEWFDISWPPYQPREMRRERAVADGLSASVSHVLGILGRTLCGIQEAGMAASPPVNGGCRSGRTSVVPAGKQRVSSMSVGRRQ